MILRASSYALLFAILAFLYKHFNVDFAITDFKNFTDALLAVSGMVFTLMGIWIAFLYPNALSRIIDPKKIETVDFSKSLSETRRLESIVGSVLKSGIAVVIVLFIFLTKVILSRLPFYAAHILIFKSIALSTVTVLSFLQLEAVLSVVLANIMFINDLHRRREERQADDDL